MSDAAITTIVTGLVTLAGLLFGYLKFKAELKKNADNIETKVDHNTAITRVGVEKVDQVRYKTDNAVSEIKAAKEVTETVASKLNGGVDDAVSKAIAPLQKALDDHAAKDDKNMEEINKKFDELNDYVHKRNHDMLTAMQTQTNQLGAIVELVKDKNDKTK